MSYDYGRRAVWIDRLAAEPDPHSYELCQTCADRTSAPRGWVLTDLRARSLFEAAS